MTDSGGVLQRALRATTRAVRDAIVAETGQDEPSFFAQRLSDHFSTDVTTLPIVSDSFPLREHMNVQVALDAMLARAGRTHALLGVARNFMGGTDFASLLAKSSRLLGFNAITQGPVEFARYELPDGASVSAVENALFLVRDGDQRFAMLVATPPEQQRYIRSFTVQVMAESPARADAVVAELRALIRERNLYRGRVISLVVEQHDVGVKFHTLPKVDRDDVILPEGLLDRIERQTVRFSQHAERLRAMRRHIKRGVLFHGPPGTGKTFTAMHLASCMPDRTTLIVTGRAQGLIEQSCQLARMLQPALVIIEDVDLIAEDRESNNACNTPLLFELLNQMDGLSGDSDVLFVLTTNRPSILEPALAARPGRIDQAIEIPLPDAECRRRLIALYSKGLPMAVEDLDDVVTRTEGASGAFIKELLRKSALIAVDRGGEAVTDDDVRGAFRELVVDGGPLTRALLGVRSYETQRS
ncbi:MAG: AAA family ATPase [Polyangiales bacterium]